MKKLVLSIAAASMLWFLQPAQPTFAGSFSNHPIPASQFSSEQHIMLQNLLHLLESLWHSKEKKSTQKEKSEDVQTSVEIRSRTSRSFDRDSTNMDRDAFAPASDILQPLQEAQTFSAPLQQEQESTEQFVQEIPAPTPVPTPTPAPEPTVDPGIRKAQSIIEEAKKYQGLHYVWGGTSPSGFDCSGFVYYLYGKNDISLPRVSFSQFKTGTGISRDQLEPGDLVFFNTDGTGASHVGIYIGDGSFIHSSSGAKKVTISTLSDGFYNSHYLGARRVLK